VMRKAFFVFALFIHDPRNSCLEMLAGLFL
jgi:hypothetical protein